MWINAIQQTLLLIFLTSLIAITIGSLTAIAAWWSNKTWAYYVPLLMLGVPPWMVSYFMSDYGYMNPWLGASISLGFCGAVYPHSLVSASLANRAHKAWEMMVVVNGKNFKSLFTAIWPSLKVSLLPSFAIMAAECVADFGVSNFYGINTITMTTYNIWTSTWSMAGIGWGVFLLALLGIAISRLDVMSVSSLQNDNTSKSNTIWAILAVTPTVALLVFGIFKSVEWIVLGAEFHSDDFIKEFVNTLYLTITVVAICIGVSLLYLANVAKGFLERTGLGFYALPGVVIGAVILYVFGAWVSLFVLLSIAIFIRYYGLMINTIAVADKGNQKYFEVVDFYAPTRKKRLQAKAKIVLPSVALGVSLIVLDVIRELPISMILQPMNFQTLAMRMNYIARNEAIPNLGPHSLVILSLGIILCCAIIKLIYDSDKKSKL